MYIPLNDNLKSAHIKKEVIVRAPLPLPFKNLYLYMKPVGDIIRDFSLEVL